MKAARYNGRKGEVEIGERRLSPGDVVGEPASGAEVEGCPGVVVDLLRRGDFEEVEIPGPAEAEAGRQAALRSLERPGVARVVSDLNRTDHTTDEVGDDLED